jgi:hypothetical protein
MQSEKVGTLGTEKAFHRAKALLDLKPAFGEYPARHACDCWYWQDFGSLVPVVIRYPPDLTVN